MKDSTVEKSERALRRMVARLPEMSVGDSRAILESLSQAQQARVADMLQKLEGNEPRRRPSPPLDPNVLPPGLSPWLVERLGASPAERTDAADNHGMTDHAVEALRASARELDPPPLGPRRSESLLGLFTRRTLGQAAPSFPQIP